MRNHKTSMQYDVIFNECRTHFLKKKFFIPKKFCNYILMKIYQNNWIEIVNYSVLAGIMIQQKKIDSLLSATIIDVYDKYIKKAKSLMEKKNSDYEEAWKYMSISSIKDLIMQKIFRIQGMEKRLSESEVENYAYKVQDNYIDILNYAIFALIKMKNP
ncbi:hypothetical protein DM815_03130 (plasmid) [Blattabacterium sp. (Cryptocercus kyebangensis)]|uniref:DUF1599 domain-containing protein n=1 Tax=Blattabacterium sp. (Cryptocercus kyebangensis) TaxID=298656 RepID=UPI000D7C5121|nr:DUF1599 domain-containing protein [Blattabacterium sp. (Cryptocercus kyebangensis)]AWU44049.1 hypothetical protein DM815_03130 [Blattabacterium sp. (Cryptocercus kyebangensis)]